MPEPRKPTRWWWIRHAPAQDVAGKFAPKSAALAPIAEAAFLPLRTTLPAGAVWLTSPLPRAKQTCELLKKSTDAIVEPAFTEQDFGAWEGRTYDEIWQETQQLKEWDNPAHLHPPQGESFAQMCARVESAVARLTLQHEGADIVAVAHAGVIRAAAGMAGGLAPEKALMLSVAPLSLYEIHYQNGAWMVARASASAA